MHRQCLLIFTRLLVKEPFPHISPWISLSTKSSNLIFEEKQSTIDTKNYFHIPLIYKRKFNSSALKKKENHSKSTKYEKKSTLEDKKDKIFKALFDEPDNSKDDKNKKNYLQDIDISDDSFWNASTESQNNFSSNKRQRSPTKQRRRHNKTKELSDDNLWRSVSGSQNRLDLKDRRTKREHLPNATHSNDVDSTLQLTTKRIAKKPPTADRDKDMLRVLQQLQEVISELGIEPDDGKTVQKDLSRRFKLLQEQKAATDTADFESLLKEIKISSADKDSSRGFQWDNLQQAPPYVEGDTTFSMNLDSGERLGFFKKDDFVEEQELMNPDQSSWSALDWYKHYSAKNDERIGLDIGKYFASDPYDELVRWTNEDKMWKFPINNEAGMDEEAEVPFYEHVFLEDKLNEGDWCPKTGPIRNFMTSVTVALSQNAYLTVQEKHEHIEWFRDYFMERLETIKTLGLIEK